MKKFTLTLFITLIGTVTIYAQAPQAFSYQAVVHNSSGEIIPNQPVSFRMGIIQDSINGTPVYSEIHNKTTNPFGLISLEIGNGTLESGVFKAIRWGASQHFLKVELDDTGGNNYQLMGISQLMSVPYGLNAGSVTLTSPDGRTYEVTVDNVGNLGTNCFPQPTTADAGPAQVDVCTPTVLEGNTPVYGEGMWTIVGENGEVADPTNPTSEFSGIPGNSYTLYWTITNGCGFTQDDVPISFMAPPTVAEAGPDQTDAPHPTTLAANTPTNGTGTWTIESGTGGSISEPTNPTSEFSGTADSSYTLRWTISATCDTTFDEVNIEFFEGCHQATVTDIDGNIYNVVEIGNQCWMKENLKTITYANGTPIPNVTDNTAWSNLTTGAYVWYDNDISWKDKYGALYNCYAAINSNGLCPEGWHVPTDAEWTIMTDFIGGIDPPHGNELKSCRQVNSPLGGDCNTSEHPRWEEDIINGNFGTDDYGFSALPGGLRIYSGTFINTGETGYWWSSTEFSSYSPLRSLYYGTGHISMGTWYKSYGLSVRCLRD